MYNQKNIQVKGICSNTLMKTKLILIILTLYAIAMIICPTSKVLGVTHTLLKDSGADKLEVVSEGTPTNSEYDFCLKAYSNSYIELWGYNGTVAGNDKVKYFMPEDPSLSGKIGCYIYNCGNYRGTNLNLKCTFFWDQNENNIPPLISPGVFREDRISFSFRTAAYGVIFEVIDDNKKPVNLNMSFTIGDIDSDQYFGVYANNGSINKIQCVDYCNVYYRKVDSYNWFYAENIPSAAGLEAAVRLEFKNTNKFTIWYGCEHDKYSKSNVERFDDGTTDEMLLDAVNYCRNLIDAGETTSKEYHVSVGYVDGTVFGPCSISTPTKTVSDSNEKNVKENTLISESEEYYYDIIQYVPFEHNSNYYESFEISDTLPSCVDYISATVLDYAEKDITNKFTINNNNNTITARANDTKTSSFYFNTYILRIKVKLNKDIIYAQNSGDNWEFNSSTNTISIHNTAKVNVKRGENYTNSSNKVTSKFYYTNIAGTKLWEDDDNLSGVRPSNYTVRLYADKMYLTKTPFSDKNWSFTRLPKYNSTTGKTINYTIEEDEIVINNMGKYIPTINGTDIVNILYYNIITSIENGTITDSCIAKIHTNKDIIFSPYEGYKVKSINVDGNFIDITPYIKGGKISFEDITKNHSVEVVCEKIRPKVTIKTEITNGVITPGSVTVVEYNANNTASIIITPNPGYKLDSVTFDENVYEISDLVKNEDGSYTLNIDDKNIKEDIEHIVIAVCSLKDAEVIVKHVNEENEEIYKSSTITGKVFETYETKEENIPEYVLKEKPANATGTMKEETITVVYVYKLKDTKVIAKYVDEAGKEIAKAEILSGKVRDEYTTPVKEIKDYVLTKMPDNATGTMKEKTITVVYVYKLKDAKVIAKYVDEALNAIAETETISGKVKDEYTTPVKEIKDYELIKMPDNATGTMKEETITVTYVYKLKDTKVIAKYVDEDENEIAEPETIPGKVRDEYTTPVKEIKDYELTKMPDDATGIMKEETITVTYVYKLKDTKVVVKYVDEALNEIAESETISGKVKDEYTTPVKEIKEYELTKMPDNATGKMTEETITVVYVYKLKDTKIIVKYVDEAGKELAKRETIPGKVRDEYTTPVKEIKDYELTKIPDDATGTMKEETITVTYVYKLKDTKVIAKYVDEARKEIAESETIPGKVRDTYTTEPKEIKEYELTKMPDNATGKMTEEQIIVTYVYNFKDTNVLVKYVDETGSKLAETEIIPGKVRDTYTTEPKEIKDYELTKMPDNATGKMTEEQTIVTYVYKLKDTEVIVKYVNESGKEIAESEVISGKVRDPYTATDKKVKNYELVKVPENKEGTMTEETITVVYVYKLKDTKVIAEYVDESGKELADKVVKEGKVFDSYKTEEKIIPGYELTKVPENKEGTMKEETITVTYVYKLKDTKIVVKYEDEEGKELVNSETIPGKVFDSYNTEGKNIAGYELIETPKNNKGIMTEDTIVVTYKYKKLPFDIKIAKEINKIIQGDKIIQSDKITDNQLTKIEIVGSKMKNEEIKVFYTIRVSNTGKIAGKIGKVIDYIPEGLEFIPDDNEKYWIIEGTTIETDILKDTELKPGETIELNVVLRWKKDENNTGIKDNVVKLCDLTNEFNYEDINPNNNESDAKLIISVKTGVEDNSIIAIIIITSLLCLTIGTSYKIKKIC